GHDLLPPAETIETGRSAMRLVKYVGETVFTGLLPKWFPKPGAAAARRDTETMRRSVNRIIAKCRTEKEVAASLIEMLINAVDEETQEGMTEQQLYDEIITMFVAGYETTSTALGWLFIALTHHPEVAEKLQAEIESV